MVKCVVSGCPNRVCSRGVLSRPPKRFFSLPADPARVKVWLAALRETDKQDSTEQQFICEDHFLSDHITPQGVSDDAIPIMPPYLDGPLGVISPWGAESSEEEEQWAGKDEAADEDEDDEAAVAPAAPPAGQQLSDGGEQDPPQPEALSSPAPPPGKEVNRGKTFTRNDVSLGFLTKRFLELMLASPDGVLDLRQVAASLHTRRRRVYDITNVLDGVCLIKKQSANTIKWISRSPVSSFLGRSHQRFHRELENLKTVEQTLDGLIKTCAQQLFDMTDDTQNTQSAYVTHDDIRHIRVFQEQTVIVVKAPEETKLEVPTPKEDSIQVHLKGGKGPIKVLTCEMDRPGDAATSDPDQQSRCFTTLEESRINTSTLHTETSTPQSAVQSA
ncbi:transcription factor E2F6 isoform X2 [Myripristis murdjan]|uniref:transcription factor E2F6 isoform X2 n=1 Tax=Myripristis murdjan TaxID=586833 RepID=UPI0011761501|nr:transcription factor E2F2-like isoform X2 [Myripristis murdjan]